MNYPNDVMDVDNGPHHDANGQRVDPQFDYELALEAQRHNVPEDGRELLVGLDDPDFGALPDADADSDDASDEAITPAVDATSAAEQAGEEDQASEVTDDNGRDIVVFWCPRCTISVLYPTGAECQAHMDHGQHLYPVNDPAEDSVSVLTRDYEQWLDVIYTYWELVYAYVDRDTRDLELPAVAEAVVTWEAQYYAEIRWLFDNERLHAGLEERLAWLCAHDKWLSQYCFLVLGRPPRSTPLARRYADELRQQYGAMIWISDTADGGVDSCTIAIPPI